MARYQISEFRAKTILTDALGQTYEGQSLDSQENWKTHLQKLGPASSYVCKVDEGVKGRFKRGLVKLDVLRAEIPLTARDLFSKGYRYALVEPNVPHDRSAERYVSITRQRAGLEVLTNRHGGVDVNDATDSIKRYAYDADSAPRIAADLDIQESQLAAIVAAFDANHFGFLEINPLVVAPDGQICLLDAAVEVDAEAASLVSGRWTLEDLRNHRTITPEEAAVLELALRSQSSFRLEVLNPEGQVFLLLSGGGASVTLADEVNNQGYGKQLANYGEYSGNPTVDETYIYTKQIVSLLLKSPARPKVLVIAGGVANFTDIRVTFTGVIRALDEFKHELAKQEIRVFVRRGGPFEAQGLARMDAFLRDAGLYGVVAGPEMILAEIIPLALTALKTGVIR